MSEDTKTKLLKILKGAVIAGLGAVLVSAAQALQIMDFGAHKDLAVAAASILVNIGKVLAGL